MISDESSIENSIEEIDNQLPSISAGEIIIGSLVALDEIGQPLVDYPQNSTGQPLVAVSTLGLTKANIGRQVALLFANGNLGNPVIMGMIHNSLQTLLENYDSPKKENTNNVNLEAALAPDDVLLDGNKLVFEAKEEIVLKCGESSITLTKSGKILIRGKYLLNRSSGVNRIMGGSVQVN